MDTNGFIWHAGYIDPGILSCKLLLAGAKVFWAGYQVYLVPSLLWGKPVALPVNLVAQVNV